MSQMPHSQTDIFISGGGVAGLTAAAAFGTAGFRTVCVDPTPPVTSGTAQGADIRTTAFLNPSVKVLEAAGLWDRLAPHAAALQIMRIVDAGGTEPTARLVRDFNAAEISDQPFGWNLPNWLLRREMVAHLEDLPNVDFRAGVATTGLLTRTHGAEVSLSDGTRLTSQLVIAADGRDSFIRSQSGIGVKTHYYGQKALAFGVTHPVAHDNVSTEIHRTGGPFTLVPLPDRDGQHCSAVVWMEHGPKADALAHMPVAEFEAEMLARSTGILGPLTLFTSRSVWPMRAQIAHRLDAERVALIAEAAHVIPPIGAQGLNMSLADIGALLDLCIDNRATLGERSTLRRYHQRRWPEIRARVAGVDLLNRAAMVGPKPLRDLRAGTLGALYGLKPVRQLMMRAGLGMR